MPSLASRGKDLAAVQILQGDKSLTLQRQGDAWALKERDGYKVLPEKVRTLVVQLANAQLVERKTHLPARHATLELEDPVAKDAKSRMIRVLDASGGAIGEIIVGKQRAEVFGSNRPGVYVRRPSEAQTWLAVGPLDAPLDTRDWVDRKFFESDGTKLASITWHAPGTTAKESLRIKRKAAADGKAGADAKDGMFEIDGIPAGKKLKANETAEAIARTYARLELDDVRKTQPADKETKVGQSIFATTDGLTVTFDMHAKGGESWTTVTAKGEGAAKTAADALNARTQGWQFKIPTGIAEQMFKTSTDLFEDNDAKG